MATKRNMVGELMNGVAAMKAQRTGKITLRNYKVELRTLPEVKPKMIKQVRVASTAPAASSPANSSPTNAPSKNGSKDAPSPTPGGRPAAARSQIPGHIRALEAVGQVEKRSRYVAAGVPRARDLK